MDIGWRKTHLQPGMISLPTLSRFHVIGLFPRHSYFILSCCPIKYNVTANVLAIIIDLSLQSSSKLGNFTSSVTHLSRFVACLS